MTGQPFAVEMSGAAPGDVPALMGRLLAGLRFAWDGIYLISEPTSGGLMVTRADGGGSFRASDPVEARDAIVADHARRPMARLEAGALQRRIDWERAHPDASWTAPSTYHKVTWTDAGGKTQQESAPTVDTMLRRLQSRGLT